MVSQFLMIFQVHQTADLQIRFFIRGRHNYLDIYNLSQSYFYLPEKTIRNFSNKNILFNQTLKDIEPIYRNVAGQDMSYDEFKKLWRKSWEED